MGNAAEKAAAAAAAEATGGGRTSPSETGGELFEEEGSSKHNKDSTQAPYRRYYPRSLNHFHQHHAVAASASTSTTNTTNKEIFRNSCPLFEQASPHRKRLRRNDETTSLPPPTTPAPSWTSPNQSPYQRFNLNLSSAPASARTTPMSSANPAGARSNIIRCSDNLEIDERGEIAVDDDDDESTTRAGSSSVRRKFLEPPTGGPITKAVISRGLRARFKSFSAWLLSEPAKASFPNSQSFPSGFAGGSLKRWSSLRASFSFGNASKLRRDTELRSSLNTPSRSRLPAAAAGAGALETSTTTAGQSSIASLNSLSDGRTPWPVPWLEAIFLPEFPSKGSVNEKTFTIIGTIAKGAFGKVYRVSLKASPEKIFAMKVQSKSDVITQNAMQQIKDEVSIHQMFADYPFIAQLYCTWQSRSKLYIVLQYVAGYGDLYQLWRDEGPFNEEATRIWGAELAMAIDYMHANGVIYRDLKMENIMLDDDGHVQLVDFGLAKWLYYGDRTSTICGTLQYMAPEVLQGEMYNHAADWWSLGVLLHTLMFGSYPYSGADNHTSVKIDDYVAPPTLSLEAQTLLSKLLRKDPNWRLRSFTVYKTQAFFRNLSFDAIRNKSIHPFDYIPRMRRCNTCNVVNEDLEGLEDSDLAMFQEDYDALKNFDSFYGEEKL